MLRFRYAFFLAVFPFFTGNVMAQNAAHEAHIRASARAAKNLFVASGAPALQKSIEACYQGADQKPDIDAFILEAERCLAEDSIGLIVFVSYKRGMEKMGRSFDDPFLNPDAHASRTAHFLKNRSLPAGEERKFSDRVFAISYDEFLRSSSPAPSPVKPETK